MRAPDQPETEALAQLRRLLRLAEETGLYLDVTGLACYRPADAPAWYDKLDEKGRWAAQANFWDAVAEVCQPSAAVFCYDLMNEPVVPGEKRGAGRWGSGHLLGGFDFVQFITLDPAGRERNEIAATWTHQMATAIRKRDSTHLITVGLLPWSEQWGHLSGFLPADLAKDVDFLSVHIYPDSHKLAESRESLRKVDVGKPVVIEETFPLSCNGAELEDFLRWSRELANGWVGHYEGHSLEELDDLDGLGTLTPAQGVYREWLRLFVDLRPEFSPDP